MPSTTRSSRRTRERREDVSRRVLSAVETLMADGTPYTELPMQLIAERADVARSTLYLHFPDKGRLLLALGGQATDALFGEAVTWWSTDHGDGETGVAHAMREMIQAYRGHRRVLHALTEVAGYDPDVAAFWRTRLRAFMEVVQHRLDAEQRAGAVAARMDTATTAQVLTWMVERTISTHCRHDDHDDPAPDDDRLADALARSIWLTIYGDAPT